MMMWLSRNPDFFLACLQFVDVESLFSDLGLFILYWFKSSDE